MFLKISNSEIDFCKIFIRNINIEYVKFLFVKIKKTEYLLLVISINRDIYCIQVRFLLLFL